MEATVLVLHVEVDVERYLLHNKTVKSELSNDTKITLLH